MANGERIFLQRRPCPYTWNLLPALCPAACLCAAGAAVAAAEMPKHMKLKWNLF